MQRLKKDTHQQQAALADYCRTGEQDSLIGITPERIETYRRLVFSNVRDALDRSYPLTKNLLTEKEWALLVNDFFMLHSCAHPQIWRMPYELIAFVNKHKSSLEEKYPQITDLMNFEWKEIELHMMPDKAFPVHTCLEIERDPWILNPEHELMRFTYPVHQKNARYISITDYGVYFCIGFRDRNEGKVHFIHLTPLLAEILSRLSDTALPIKEAYDQGAKAMNVEQGFGTVEPQLYQFYAQMREKGLFL